MSRKRYVSPGQIEYKGYAIGLTEDGQIACRELNLVGNTLEEVKKAIRDLQTKVAKLPMKDVWFSPQYEDKYFLGRSNGKRVGYSQTYVWVSWKDHRGKSHKEQKYSYKVYPDTPENREKIERINYLIGARKDIDDQIDDITGELVIINGDGE